MSTLSKAFVILVFAAACVFVGMQAVLFSMKMDFKDKWIKEVNYHYQTQQVKNSEIAALNVELENRGSVLKILNEKIGVLEGELGGRSARLSDAQKQLDVANQLLVKYEANQGVFVRQLEVQLQQLADMSERVEGYRKKVLQLNGDYSGVLQELQYARQESERLQRDQAEIEAKVVELARENKSYEERLAALAIRGIPTDAVGARKKLEGKVTAVSDQFKLVIVNIGKDQGVLEGDEFTVYRGAQFIAKIQIERVDRAWAAGRVVVQKGDAPRVADSVSNDILVSGSKSQGGN